MWLLLEGLTKILAALRSGTLCLKNKSVPGWRLQPGNVGFQFSLQLLVLSWVTHSLIYIAFSPRAFCWFSSIGPHLQNALLYNFNLFMVKREHFAAKPNQTRPKLYLVKWFLSLVHQDRPPIQTWNVMKDFIKSWVLSEMKSWGESPLCSVEGLDGVVSTFLYSWMAQGEGPRPTASDGVQGFCTSPSDGCWVLHRTVGFHNNPLGDDKEYYNFSLNLSSSHPLIFFFCVYFYNM